ncbi:hypothetical protein [Thalassobellus citreus]|uniref:hypothetical protein n=1 Tax=Thalassobellus citreus TaxID=3367752 RepID=UPI0037A5D8D1
MKTLKYFFTLLSLAILSFSCNYDLDDITEGPALTEDPVINETDSIKIWILTHKRYESPGIYLYNETSSTIELKLELPKNLKSPHALAFDGESLWVGGEVENESIYQLNPETGAIISEIKNISTEGIAVKDDYLYYSGLSSINKIEKNGTLVEEISTKNSSYKIPDITIDGNDLYYLRYSEKEPVVKLNLSNKKENRITLAESTGTYCLTVFNNEIVTIMPFNEISRFNLQTGQLISTNTTELKGWITAIAPYYEK